MLKRRLLLLRPADLPRLPADSRRLCRPAFPPPVAQRRKGSGYRVNESLPELVPFNQRVHQVLTDAPPQAPRDLSLFSFRVDGFALAVLSDRRTIQELDRKTRPRRDASAPG